MSKKNDYTHFARNYAANFPLLSYTTIQANFWILASLMLGFSFHFYGLAMAKYPSQPPVNLWTLLLAAILYGLIYGVIQGVLDFKIERKLIARGSFGRYIIMKLLYSLALSILLYWLCWFLLGRQIERLWMNRGDTPFTSSAPKYLFYVYLMYHFIMNILLVFINQVNRKYGPGILIPLLLGKYSQPVEEERIFMFMDLKSSTTLAESMGHLNYSSFIRDSFLDIDALVVSYDAEVYQYVGDEIVLTWKLNGSKERIACINFFFACQQTFRNKEESYLQKFGFPPVFKAGVHSGMVTAVEIGNIKREIAYHGDILNTAARIQSLCNEYEQQLLVSADFLSGITALNLHAKSLGNIKFKGKLTDTEVFSINLVDQT